MVVMMLVVLLIRLSLLRRQMLQVVKVEVEFVGAEAVGVLTSLPLEEESSLIVLQEVVEASEELVLAVTDKDVEQRLPHRRKLRRLIVFVPGLGKDFDPFDGDEVDGVLVVLLREDCPDELLAGALAHGVVDEVRGRAAQRLEMTALNFLDDLLVVAFLVLILEFVLLELDLLVLDSLLGDFSSEDLPVAIPSALHLFLL